MVPTPAGMPTWMRWSSAGLALTLFALAVACIGFGIYGWGLPPVRPLATFIAALGLLGLALAALCLWGLIHRHSARGRNIGFAVILAGILSLLSLALVESGLAIMQPALTLTQAVRYSPKMFRQSAYLPFQLKPGYRAATPSREADGEVSLTINSHGFRGDEFDWVKPPATYRILVLGDSFAMNRAVDDHEVHTAVLQRRLNRRGDARFRFEVINAGYADGYSPDAYLAFMQQQGFSLDPDFVMMQYFVLNDFNDLLETEVLETRNEMPFRVRSRHRYVDQDGRYRRNSSLKYKLPILRNSYLYVTLYEVLGAEDALAALAPRFVPDYPSVNFSPNNLGISPRDVYVQARERPPILQAKFSESLRYVRLLERACRSAGIEFSLFLVPTGIQVAEQHWPRRLADDWDDPNPQKQIRNALAGTEVRIFDPLETFRAALVRGALYFGARQNGHWTAAGNRVAAEAMEAHLIGISAVANGLNAVATRAKSAESLGRRPSSGDR